MDERSKVLIAKMINLRLMCRLTVLNRWRSVLVVPGESIVKQKWFFAFLTIPRRQISLSRQIKRSGNFFKLIKPTVYHKNVRRAFSGQESFSVFALQARCQLSDEMCQIGNSALVANLTPKHSKLEAVFWHENISASLPYELNSRFIFHFLVSLLLLRFREQQQKRQDARSKAETYSRAISSIIRAIRKTFSS